MEMHHVVFPFNSDVEQTKAPQVGKKICNILHHVD